MKLINEQYSFIQSSRSALLKYCTTISPHHFVEPLEAFSNKSMRDLLVHVAETYLFWISHFAFQNVSHSKAETFTSVMEIRALYTEVDFHVFELIKTYEGAWEDQVKGSIKGIQKEISVSAFQLFTHVTTHEFHHKGQILSMSRLLGYTPVDTDIIRF